MMFDKILPSRQTAADVSSQEDSMARMEMLNVIVNSEWSMVNGQWSMVNGQWSMVNHYSSHEIT